MGNCEHYWIKNIAKLLEEECLLKADNNGG